MNGNLYTVELISDLLCTSVGPFSSSCHKQSIIHYLSTPRYTPLKSLFWKYFVLFTFQFAKMIEKVSGIRKIDFLLTLQTFTNLTVGKNNNDSKALHFLRNFFYTGKCIADLLYLNINRLKSQHSFLCS